MSRKEIYDQRLHRLTADSIVIAVGGWLYGFLEITPLKGKKKKLPVLVIIIINFIIYPH